MIRGVDPKVAWRTCVSLADLAVASLLEAQRARWPMDAAGHARCAMDAVLGLRAATQALSPMQVSRRLDNEKLGIQLSETLAACELIVVAGEKLDYSRDTSVVFVAYTLPIALRSARKLRRLFR